MARVPVASISPVTYTSLAESPVGPPTARCPATTVLPVSPATVNLFDEIASDPSNAVTANFPLFTSTSPATSSVLDSVAAPELQRARQRRRSRHIQRARQRRSSRAQAAQRSRSRHVQRPRHHRVARVASHRELVRRNRQRPVRCRHRKLPTVHVHVACHIQRARQRRSSRHVHRARQRRRSRHIQRARQRRSSRAQAAQRSPRRPASPPPPCCPCRQPP